MGRQFQGRTGKSYLFAACSNVCFSEAEDRQFNSGEYNVRDIICINCSQILGWKYEYGYGYQTTKQQQQQPF
ncbi:yippee-like protein [Cavenderia fasciculata]|uniref:Yippee-like protein n=1 Tax=Cavenderia fasciculata TaxID=261658 RepID=F4QBT5_CACFS|nr:yippee-like protein [Cavenderia fasciculata]EGG14673.1 yippee-like protein [Cavenderia fasciculata]|eukprot:XP_004351181.1 yippee-like protein [Cavenderia fasciculata]